MITQTLYGILVVEIDSCGKLNIMV